MTVQFGYHPSSQSPFFTPSRGHNIISDMRAREARENAAALAAERDARMAELMRQGMLRRKKVQRVLERLEAAPATPQLPMAKIAREVAYKYAVTVNDIRSERRAPYLVAARHEVFWRCKTETENSYPAIGKFFRRDHTTVIAGVRKHEARLAGEGK